MNNKIIINNNGFSIVELMVFIAIIIILFLVIMPLLKGCSKSNENSGYDVNTQKNTGVIPSANEEKQGGLNVGTDTSGKEENGPLSIVVTTKDGNIAFWFCKPVKEEVSASDLRSKLDKSKSYDFYCDYNLTKYNYDELEKTVDDLKVEGYTCKIFDLNQTEREKLEYGK